MTETQTVPVDVLPTAETGGRSAVYRVFGDADRLLYVGSTKRPRQRWHEHRSRTVWWPLARTYSLVWLPDRAAAYAAEAQAIAIEAPEFNHVWRPRPASPPLALPQIEQVADALQTVEHIEDPVARAAAVSEVLRYVEKLEPKWRDLRRQAVLDLRASKVPYRRIADMIKVSLGTVQSIERGHAGA